MTESASPQAAALAPVPSIVTDTLDRLSLIPIIKSALGQIKKDEALTIEDQISLTEVEAPPFHEEARAEYFARQLKDLGLKNVRIDGIGNVIGVRPGSGNGPRLVLGAHLDTVFPKGTNVKVRRENGILYAPGISDDARGLAVLLEVLRTLNAFDIKTEGDLLFIATVGEEGNGDLRGSKHLFAAGEEHIDGFISVDGADIGVLLHGSTGSRRFRVTFSGPGGHSWSNFGIPNANHALGRAIAKIADLQVSESPKTTFSVGTIQGGSSINAIPAKAQLELDTRSINNDDLNKLVERILPIFEEACEAENKRWNATEETKIKLSIEPIGHRPAGDQQNDSPILLAARASMNHLGIALTTYGCASTDQNVALSLGIPATTLGGGGKEGYNHSLKEWYDPTDSYLGPQLTFLSALALVGLEAETLPLLPKRK